jgi:ATP-dependent DNA helicase RecG
LTRPAANRAGHVERGRRVSDPFTAPVSSLTGVGARIAEKLGRLGVHKLGDLLCLLPQRYEDRTQLTAIGSLRPGIKAQIQGAIELAEVVYRRRRSLLCRVADGTGSITLRLFNFTSAQQQRLRRGVTLRCFGEVRVGPTGLEMVHPEHRVVDESDAAVPVTLTPVYPSTEGLYQQKIRQLVEQTLAVCDRAQLEDLLAGYLEAGWPTIDESLRQLHQPDSGAEPSGYIAGTTRWHERVALEELVAHRLSLKLAQAERVRAPAQVLTIDDATLARLIDSLPFTLTQAQTRVVTEIRHDLGRPLPMQRLVQGDVGCGKTVVAAAAAFVCAANGLQTLVMAPTELLAEQHYGSFSRWLEPLGFRVGLLSGAQRRRSALSGAIESGELAIVVGTHALFQEAARFAEVGLVIVDEQHRFGVEQRLSLLQKGVRSKQTPHQLIMTATPIPRTLAQTFYADLDCSTIDELPPGRAPIKTVVMQERRRAELAQRIERHCRSGQQVYWVCPLIEESEALDSSAALKLEQELAAALPRLRIGVVHGRLKPAEKDAVMRAFNESRIDVLVATTVVEVGVDVPNATLMIVENAERMGLAQLHQLRGRVGRGVRPSSCVLLYKPPLSEMARERLGVMRTTQNGFEIANHDLKLRGAGEFLGTKQTGAMHFRVADLLRDSALLPLVVRISDQLLAAEPARAAALVRRWVGGGREYANV